jgi:ribose-phosphate pyrophosphokinase
MSLPPVFINLNLSPEFMYSQGMRIGFYPDGQPYVKIYTRNTQENMKKRGVRVSCSITTPKDLLILLQLSNALEHLGVEKRELHIPYLMGARSDRLMSPGDSFDLQVIANLINLCGFKKVLLLDVHSDVATALIHRSENVNNNYLVRAYTQDDAILICPDAGATKKIPNYLSWNKNLKDVVYCIKHRNLTPGKISINVLQKETCTNRNCVIIDDICDGGTTFIEIAKQIRPKHLTLIVTHGIFSNGFSELEKYFQQITTTNSYLKGSCVKSRIVTIICFNDLDFTV